MQTSKIQDGGQQKPEVEITLNRQVMAPRFNGLPRHIDITDSICHRQHCPTLPTTEIQDGGHQPEVEITFDR